MNSEKMEEQKPEVLRLFVYGTLRKGGVAEKYLEKQLLLQQNRQLSGFVMYDAGWYPFVVPAGADSLITGDVYEVAKALLPQLDSYEGEGYVKHFIEKENLFLYLKADENTEGFLQVEQGDWLAYWKAKQSSK